jgi:hypothetical protein
LRVYHVYLNEKVKVDEVSQVNKLELRNVLNARFSVEELRTLCFDLRVEYEALPGMDKNSKVRALILHCERRAQLNDLIQACARQRSDVNWGEVTGKAETPLKPTPRPAADSKINTRFTLNYSFAKFREFMQQALTLEEMVKFIKENEDFKQLGFELPLNASHVGITQKLFGYAVRRGKLQALLEQLKGRDPVLYARYEPFIESGELNITLKLPVQGSDAQLLALQARLKGEEFKQSVLRASHQALQQAIK